MFRNYFKIIWRGMIRQKMYSFVKIGGFSVGIAACLLMALFIADELSYDKSFANNDRLYRVYDRWDYNGNHDRSACLPAPFAKTLKSDYPEVEEAGRVCANELFGAGSKQVRRSDQLQNTYETSIAFADQEFLDIFQPTMVFGDLKHALDEPETIVISKRKSEQYFPNENPVGKTLLIDNDQSKPYRIGGVMDFPTKSHFQYDFLISMKGREFWKGEQSKWDCYNYFTYVLLRKGTNVSQFENKLDEITIKYFLPEALKTGNPNASKIKDILSFRLQPVSDIHLISGSIEDHLSHSDIRFIWFIGIIAVIILIIACINFINLSTAKSANKAKEVGLRKTIGAFKGNLVRQFLADSIFYSVISFALGIILATVLLPFFNQLSSKSLAIPWSSSLWILPVLALLSIVIGVLAGVYPSFYLSSFKPVSVLKGNLNRKNKTSRFRNVLVIFQFSVSITLIVGTMVIYRQMDYILNKNPGFDKDQVLLLHGTNTTADQLGALKEELLKLPDVKSVSVSDYLPVNNTKRNGNQFYIEGRAKDDLPVSGQFWQIDQDYVKTLGLHLIEGRDFSKDWQKESKSAIINQSMAQKLGLKNPVGSLITNGWGHFEVIGVVDDFNFDTMRNKIEPVCLALGFGPSIMSVKVKATDMTQTLRSVKSVWDSFSPNQPIRYSFLDQEFALMYDDVQRMGRIFGTFSVLAVIIACLGLFALSSFMIEQRTKEIGVRKVNGAKSIEVTATLNKDFLVWITVAFVIATPIAYYAMNKWLENFAYKTSLSWWIFAMAGLLALGIALLTVSFQSWKAAARNPVEALRYE